jgi:hypothetical protein
MRPNESLLHGMFLKFFNSYNNQDAANKINTLSGGNLKAFYADRSNELQKLFQIGSCAVGGRLLVININGYDEYFTPFNAHVEFQTISWEYTFNNNWEYWQCHVLRSLNNIEIVHLDSSLLKPTKRIINM